MLSDYESTVISQCNVPQGGFAKCYKVTCLETNTLYAMKIVPKSMLTKRRAKEKVIIKMTRHLVNSTVKTPCSWGQTC